MNIYYDGTKLLSLKDLDGNEPEIYICDGTRTAGKTVYFSRLMINKFIKNNSQFCLLYRNVYELNEIEKSFFQTIQELFFQNHTMSSVNYQRGIIKALLLDDKLCGFAVPLSKPDIVKKNSAMFSNVDRIFFDEFQSESNKYLPDELNNFKSIHTSIARGKGKQVRRVPVYMCSNSVSLINPYYSDLGVGYRMQENTKFLRGHGWVLEHTFNVNASEAQKTSAFNRAFSDDKYLKYSSENLYLNDNASFVEKLSGAYSYVCTVKYKDKLYAIKDYGNTLYCDKKINDKSPTKIALSLDDHDVGYVYYKNFSVLIYNLRNAFEIGMFRFFDLDCKSTIMRLVSY